MLTFTPLAALPDPGGVLTYANLAAIAAALTAANANNAAILARLTPVAIAASGAVTPNTDGTYVITKAGVAALTLAAPTATTSDGTILVITSNSAFAHTLTATGLLQTGTATVNLATFAAFAGATITLMAYQGKWNVISSTAVVLS